MSINHVRKYVGIFRITLLNAFAYRNATLISMVGNFVWLLIPYLLWQNIYTHSDNVGAYKWSDMQTYLILAFWIRSIMSFQAEFRLFNDIRSGNILMDLLRPVRHLPAKLSEMVAYGLVDGVMALPIISLIAIALANEFFVPRAPVLVFFGVSVLFGFLIQFLLSYITALIGLKTLSVVGLIWTRTSLTLIFSGTLVPLDIMPDWLSHLASILPFRAIVSSPLKIYLQEQSAADILNILALQGIWIALLLACVYFLWLYVIRNLTIQGG